MVGTSATPVSQGRMTSSRARESDMSLYADVLEPFWRVIGTVGGSEDREKRATAARLSFNEPENTPNASGENEGVDNAPPVVKRKLSLSGDLTATPDKRSRIDLDSAPRPGGTPTSPWEAKRLKAEVIATKAKITKLEARIAQQHMVRKEMQILFEEERQTAADQQRHDRDSIASLEGRLDLMRRREADLKSDLAESVRNMEKSKMQWEKEKDDLQKKIAKMKDEMLEVNMSAQGQVSEMKVDMDELAQALTASQDEVGVLKREVERLKTRAQDAASLRPQCDRQAMEIQQLQSQLRELQYEKDSYKDWQHQAKMAQERLSHMAELEREVGRLRAAERSLRDIASNKLLLEEKVTTLKAKLTAAQPARREEHAAKVKAAALEGQLSEWTGAAARRGVSSAAEFAAALDSALQRELAAVADCCAAQSQLTHNTEELATAKFEQEKAINRLAELQAVSKSMEGLVRRLQKRLLLVTRERDSYRQQLDSYEKELSVTLCGEGIAGGGTALLSARIEELERALQSYRDLLNQTDQEAHTKDVSRLRAEAVRWREEAEAARCDVSKLRAQRDRMQVQLDKLQATTFTKVLHLTDNPAANAQKNLQSELEAALEEINRLKSSTDGGSRKDAETVATLKKKLNSSEIKMQRIIEEYKSSTQEYRNVCYQLLGYKIDRAGHKNYRLSSMYAESAEEYLTFTLCDDDIEMVHTDYSAGLQDLVELHLHQHRSIPLFLSTLTVQLVQRSTMFQQESESD